MRKMGAKQVTFTVAAMALLAAALFVLIPKKSCVGEPPGPTIGSVIKIAGC